MPIQKIETLDDARVADYRNVRDADLAGRHGMFIGEGELVVRTLIERSRFETRSVLLAEGRLRAMRDAIERLPGRTPVYVMAQPQLDEIVGFHIHRGVLAAGETGAPLDARALISALAPGAQRVLVLESIFNHDNVGGVFRNAAAFGAGPVLFDGRTGDPLYRKSIRVSMGGALRVPFARIEVAEAISVLRTHRFVTCALTPRADAEAIDVFRARGLPERVALLLGSEGPGLTEASLGAADARLRIPIASDVDSLNVAVAAGIALHALAPS